ncbi:hypothetical protein F5880DRAFT_1541542 [Lentinula raphanica]|nr:hypothetical protein F5880DRAFT_1541542 [Lentinula raphanica]
MHLFRIVFMWRSLAVHVILLSMITAAIALPIGTDTTETGNEQEIVARSGEAGSSSTVSPTELFVPLNNSIKPPLCIAFLTVRTKRIRKNPTEADCEPYSAHDNFEYLNTPPFFCF